MKKVLIFVIVIIVAGVVYYQMAGNKSPSSENENTNNPPAPKIDMKITSSEFKNNEEIPVKFTCDGEGISPPLEFSGVPIEAKELVLIMDDPDAPVGTWVHSTLWGVDPAVN